MKFNFFCQVNKNQKLFKHFELYRVHSNSSKGSNRSDAQPANRLNGANGIPVENVAHSHMP